MAEPTLGARILGAAEAYDLAAADLRGRTIPPREANSRVNAALDRLRALCARADAAEWLAKADAAYVAVCRENAHRQDHEVQDTWELWCARRDARTAWRALGEVPS